MEGPSGSAQLASCMQCTYKNIMSIVGDRLKQKWASDLWDIDEACREQCSNSTYFVVLFCAALTCVSV